MCGSRDFASRNTDKAPHVHDGILLCTHGEGIRVAECFTDDVTDGGFPEFRFALFDEPGIFRETGCVNDHGNPIFVGYGACNPDVPDGKPAFQEGFLADLIRFHQKIVVFAIEQDLPDEHALIRENEYQMALESMGISAEVYLFAQRVQAAVVEKEMGKFLLFTTKNFLEMETEQFRAFSLNTVMKLQSLMDFERRDTFTPAELAKSCRMAPRSANRLLEKLIHAGYAHIVGSSVRSASGRPCRVIRIDFL